MVCMGSLSCSESSVVGEDFMESSGFSLEVTSSIPLQFSTVRFDSLVTSQSNRTLFGGKSGTPYGDLTMESFFLFELEPFTVDEGLRYDSITLTLPMDGYTLYLDEEAVRQTIVVEQLSGELTYLENEGELYNYSDIEGATDVSGDLLARKAFFWASDRIRDLEIRLPDTFGEHLFVRLKDEHEIFQDTDKANEYLKGLKVYLETPDFIVGLAKDSIKLSIHTTDAGSLSNQDFDFSIGFSPNYTKYTHQNIPQGLVLQDLEDKSISDSLDNRSYLIAGLGYATLIDLTRVRDLIESGDEFILAEAEIRLKWFEQSHGQYPEYLVVQLVDGNYNDLAGGQTFRFNLTHSEENSRDNYYVLNATDIVGFILDQPIGLAYYLFLTLPDFQSTANSVVLGDQLLASEITIYTIKN